MLSELFRLLRKNRKILPLDGIVYERKYSYNDVSFLRKLFYWVLFVFPIHNQRHTFIQNIAINLVDCFVVLFHLYIISSDIYIMYKIIKVLPLGMLFSTLFTDVCSLGLRVILIKKRHVIVKTLSAIQDLNSELGNSVKRRNSKLNILLSVVLLVMVSLFYFADGIRNLLNPSRRDYYQQDTFFGWYSKNIFAALVSVLSMDVLLQQQIFIMPGFCAIFCVCAFRNMNQVIYNFQNKLLLMPRNNLDAIFVTFNIYSPKINFCISELEKSLSCILTLIQGYLIWDIFNFTTLLIKHDISRKELLPILNESMSLLKMISMFLILGFSSASVHDASLSVKKTVFQLVASISPKADNRSCLMLKMAEDFSAVTVINTGWKLYSCKRGMVLKIAGAVFTYGTILAQIGA